MNLLSNRVEIRDTYNAPTFGLDERNGIPLAVTADKKAEGKLQGLVTEKSVMIEPKFFNAAMAKNRVSICMAANSEWMLPASGDERRYAAFNVDNKYAVGQATEEVRIAYFDALHTEMYKKGGIEAIMDALLSMDLGDWCPRKEIPDTDALHEQKELSLKPLDKYWVHLLDSSYLPNNKYNAPHEATAAALLRDAVFNVPNGRHDFENGKLGRYLRAHGFVPPRNDFLYIFVLDAASRSVPNVVALKVS
jgi:hypothetical protein